MNTTLRCPGQDKRFWNVKDIIEVKCPYCSSVIEFWKDDPMRYCTDCGELINNPQINLNCAKWCKMAEQCLGEIPEEAIAASPVIERLKALLHKQLTSAPERMQNALDGLLQAETMLIKETGDPTIIKPATLFAGALIPPSGDEDSDYENTPLGNPANWESLLDQAGMEEEEYKKAIVDLVSKVILEKSQLSENYAIVWDAIQLQRLEIMGLVDCTNEFVVSILDSLKTECGKQMAKRFQRNQKKRA